MYSAGSDDTTRTSAANRLVVHSSLHAEKETQPKSKSARALSAVPDKPASRCHQAPTSRAAAEFRSRSPKSAGNSQAPRAKVCSRAARSAKSRPYMHSSAPDHLRDSSKSADSQTRRETAPCKENHQSDRP